MDGDGNLALARSIPGIGDHHKEKITITLQVNQLGLSADSYNSTVQITIADRYDRYRTESIAVNLIVSGGVTTPPPSMLLNPASLSFSGIVGGTNPSAKTMNLVNPTGGTLTWSMTESAACLALNTTAGMYSTVIAVTAFEGH